MRVIRFRGKDLKTSEWVYGDLHALCDAPHIHTDKTSYPFAGKRSFVDVETIGQFIGLEDINGKEVYEGDIIRLHRNEKYTYIVEWRDGCAEFIGRCQETEIGLANLNKRSEIEVIGNIYEE